MPRLFRALVVCLGLTAFSLGCGKKDNSVEMPDDKKQPPAEGPNRKNPMKDTAPPPPPARL